MSQQRYSTQRIDHLGIVAGICKEIDLSGQIDEMIGPTGRKVTVGEATEAMILNALGFVGRALYLSPEFFHNKPVGILIREGLTPEDLNDDTLGRALDKLYQRGVTEVFAKVASHALDVYGIKHQFYHIDSTSFSFHGEYEDERYGGIRITRGYSKEKRPDLKQAVVSLICTYKSSIPCWFEALDGNSSDKNEFRRIIKRYVQQLEEGEDPYFIADSALYTKENIEELSQVKWVSRVPESIKEARDLQERVGIEEMSPLPQEGYYYKEEEVEYGGVRQRWILIYSKKRYDREVKGLEKKINKERERAEKKVWHLANREFEGVEDGRREIDQIRKKLKYHTVRYHFKQVRHYKRRGRPKEGDEYQIRWKVEGKVEEDEDKINKELSRKGKFILATNELDREKLPAERVLDGYKGQGVSVERGFRFLKDPLFFADGLFLKNPERIMAMLMVMGLALLVYALAERKLREQLKRKGESIPNQVGKPTQSPTMRRVFQMFEGIDILEVKRGRRKIRMVVNLRPVHRKIIRLMGKEVQKCYFLEE